MSKKPIETNNLTIAVKALAGSKTEEIIDLGADLLGRREFKIKVNQPAVEGKANKAIIAIVAKYFAVKKSDVVLVSGQFYQNKILRINNINNK